MTTIERDQLADRYRKINVDLAALMGTRTSGGPNSEELALRAEQDAIEVRLGDYARERRSVEQSE